MRILGFCCAVVVSVDRGGLAAQAQNSHSCKLRGGGGDGGLREGIRGVLANEIRPLSQFRLVAIPCVARARRPTHPS